MADGQKPLPTKEKLAQELEKLPPVNGLERLVKRARAGMYDDYESPLATPQMQLVEDLRQIGQQGFVHRVIDGEFDGTREEARAWAMGPEGREAFLELAFQQKMKKEEQKPCPHCGKDNIEQLGNKPGGPKPGDASLCVYCAAWGIFDTDLTLRKPTEAEATKLAEDLFAQMVVKQLLEFKASQ